MTHSAFRIQMATANDAPQFWEHLRRHDLEALDPNELIFSPVTSDVRQNFEDWQRGIVASWQKTPTTLGWQRTWLLFDEENVRGEVSLTTSLPLESSLHQCKLMMGIEKPMRGRGWGTTLVQTAVDWAREQETLEWISLYVFDTNPPAKKLYEKMGFRETGRTEDLFRVRGTSVTDISMTLKL